MIRRTNLAVILFLVFGYLCVTFAYSTETNVKQYEVLPGDKFEVKFSVGVELQYCRLTINGTKRLGVNLSPKAQKDNIYYYGDGLEAGDCGVVIESVTDDMNGELIFQFSSPSSVSESQKVIQLIVARPPKSIEFVVRKNKQVVDENVEFKIGDEITASCTVFNARPEANVSMIFGDEIVSMQIDNLVVPGQQSSVYYFSKNLTQKDNKKEIKCVVDHITQPENSTFSQIVQVIHKPIIFEKIRQKSDKYMNLTLEIEANPINYTYELWFGGKPIEKSKDQIEIESIERHEINNGTSSELRILIRIRKAIESKQKIFLNATNALGSTVQPISLYMSAFTPDFEIGFGTYIIAIVALILITLVALLYVRRNRWIFSDSIHNSSHLNEDGGETVGKKKSATFHLLSGVNFVKFKSGKNATQKLTPVVESVENDQQQQPQPQQQQQHQQPSLQQQQYNGPVVVYTKEKTSNPTAPAGTTASDNLNSKANASALYAELDFPTSPTKSTPTAASATSAADKPSGFQLKQPLANSRSDYAEIVYK